MVLFPSCVPCIILLIGTRLRTARCLLSSPRSQSSAAPSSSRRGSSRRGRPSCSHSFVAGCSDLLLSLDDDDGEYYWETVAAARRVATTTSSESPLLTAIPFAFVALVFLVLTVVTVPVDESTPPPPISLPLLQDYIVDEQQPAASSSFSSEAVLPFQLGPVVTSAEFLQATLFQWKVFSLESGGFPTGFSAPGKDNNVLLELLRALVNFPKALENARVYEPHGREEFQAGADRSPMGPVVVDSGEDTDPVMVVRRCSEFIKGRGLSLVAKVDDTTLGLVSLRLRRLPPKRAMSTEEAFEAISASEYRSVAYITGLAVSRSARRRGVGATLVDFCLRKAKSWQTSGICLHVNKFNTPALRFYAALGFAVVPDWIGGYNSRRFLLFKSFDEGSSEEH